MLMSMGMAFGDQQQGACQHQRQRQQELWAYRLSQDDK
jgi:hypothetical protein